MPWTTETGRISSIVSAMFMLEILVLSLVSSKYEVLTHLSACQSCHVQNDVSWQIFAGVHHSISQNQPAFSVSVVYLHSPSYTVALVSHSTQTRQLKMSHEGWHSLNTHTTYWEQAGIKTVLLSGVESVNIIGSCGDGPNCVFCQAEHCVKVVLKSLAQKEQRVKSNVE